MLHDWHGPLPHLRRAQIYVPWGVPVCSGAGEMGGRVVLSVFKRGQEVLAAIWGFPGQSLLFCL